MTLFSMYVIANEIIGSEIYKRLKENNAEIFPQKSRDVYYRLL